MVFAIMESVAARSLADDVDPVEAGQAAFFGFMGIAIALVFASKTTQI